MQFIITVIVGEECIFTKRPFLNQEWLNIFIEVEWGKLIEHMITYTDQHLPGTQLFSANVIKCSLFALKLSYTQRRQAFIKKCLNQQRNIHTVT